MSALLLEAFALPGLVSRIVPGRAVGDHLIWQTPAWREGGGVLLVAHHDTVFPPGSFEGCIEREGCLVGPGCLDMKGGLVVVRTALAVLADLGLLAQLPLTLASVADEEIGSPESRQLWPEMARGASAALVVEGGRPGDAIVTQRRGAGGLGFRVQGRAAHAGDLRELGINAIRVLNRVLLGIETLAAAQPGATAQVVQIEGGETRNAVPAKAWGHVDFRFERAEEGQALVAGSHKIAAAIATETGAQIEVEGGVERGALERTKASLALYRRYAACAEAAGLGSSESEMLGGGSDANLVGALGVPCIDGLGPRGGGIHSPREFIEISSLAPKAEALIRFLLGIAQDQGVQT